MTNKIELLKCEVRIQRLNYTVGNCNIYMLRDDLIPFGGGGNKVRLFEYIALDIIKSKAKKIITFGSIHSNHIRVAAIVATYLGIGCDLIILHDEDNFDKDFLTPNMKMIRLCKNVKIVHCKTNEAHEFIDEYLKKQRNYYWIPGGGHTANAIHGYSDVAEYILLQKDIAFDAIFLPCGTGTTMAGMLYGMKKKIPVYGITVARSAERCEEAIKELLDINGYILKEDEIKVLPCNIRYGENTTEVEETISRLLHSDGIYLDPIYNAKSFLETVRYIEGQRSWKNVLYINTGGQPNIFA